MGCGVIYVCKTIINLTATMIPNRKFPNFLSRNSISLPNTIGENPIVMRKELVVVNAKMMKSSIKFINLKET